MKSIRLLPAFTISKIKPNLVMVKKRMLKYNKGMKKTVKDRKSILKALKILT
jgi:hypothetical protein